MNLIYLAPYTLPEGEKAHTYEHALGRRLLSLGLKELFGLDVTPEWLLSGVENTGKKGNKLDLILVDRTTEMGEVLTTYNKLNEQARDRLMGYMLALSEYAKNTKMNKKDDED